MPNATAFLDPSTLPGDHKSASVTIPNGGSIMADGVDLNQFTPVGVLLPAGWTSAGLSFAASPDGATYGALYDKDGEVMIATLAGGEYVVLDPLKFFGARWLKIRSGTAGSPVNQGADRVLTLVVRRV
jgi:hypothetical protein